MSVSRDFQEITILIPGYSIEDLPTDLNEQSAASLLNAFAVAWHPSLLARSASIPQCRQAESTELPTAQQIIIVPECAEDWLGHDWKERLSDTLSVVMSGCSDRSEWLDAIASQFGTDEQLPTELVADFLALGISHLQVMLLSRRMHHFVDPDSYLLDSEVMSAADAALTGSIDVARDHLRRAFECLLDCREQFYPVDCYLVDVCLPSDQTTAEELLQLITDTQPVSLICSGHELQQHCEKSPPLLEALQHAVQQDQLSLLTGHWHELRTSLNSLSALYSDLEQTQTWLRQTFPNGGSHWARRRFGMASSLPAVLNVFEFQSALHVVLDDGLYPDREYGQLRWQSPDGATISSVSRIPMAIDGAASFLRFADRMTESMQEDTNAVLLLARLPQLQSPWLNDLRIAAGYAPVLGQFVTMADFVEQTGGQSSPVSYDEGEYLSPCLIQSAVLKTESSITSPADLHQQRQQLESVAQTTAICAILKPKEASPGPVQQLERELNQEEALRLAIDNKDGADVQVGRLNAIAEKIKVAQTMASTELLSRIPTSNDDCRGIALINPLPWKRSTLVRWPTDAAPPAKCGSIADVRKQDGQLHVAVDVPAAGFAWLTEAKNQRPAVNIDEAKGKPLAEELLLRNQYYEVDISENTGGIAAVTFYNQRANRVSQQVAYRYEYNRTIAGDEQNRVTPYAISRLVSSRILHAGPCVGVIETTCEITSPDTEEVMARYRQITSVQRHSSCLTIQIEFDDLPFVPKGNPWMAYFAARFAWENEAASITRSMLGQARGFRMERFESPDYIEIADADSRLMVVPHGRPYHRRTGHRMLDSLLIADGESSRSFSFTLDFDNAFPMRLATEVLQPVILQETANQVPTGTDSAWILGLSAKNVINARSRIMCGTPTSETSSGTTLRMLLEETEGRSASCRILTARQPTAARICTASGHTVQDLSVSAEGVTVEFSRFQIKEVELTF